MKIIQKRQPNCPISLWIVGGDTSQPRDQWPAELKKLENLRKLLKLEATVTFVGQQPQDKLPYYYNAADVVVMPSHYESFGMAALEAMACGTPVITTNVTGVASLLDETHQALITSANHPLLLANQIEALLLDKKKLEAVSQEVREKVQDLHWNTVANKVGAVYDQLLNTR